MSYDPSNVFARVLRGELPSKKIDEDEYTFAFEDINPQAPIHILVIPKGSYVDWLDFSNNASVEEQSAFMKMIGRVASLAGIEDSGYRIISNSGDDGNQEVPHLHVHVLGGAAIGPMVSNR